MTTLEILRKYEAIIHKSEYAQIVIDLIQDAVMIFEDVSEEGISEQDIEGSLRYRISILIDVMKDGKDKDLLTDLYRELEYIN